MGLPQILIDRIKAKRNDLSRLKQLIKNKTVLARLGQIKGCAQSWSRIHEVGQAYEPLTKAFCDGFEVCMGQI